MKKVLLFFFLTGVFQLAIAQRAADSVLKQLQTARNDTSKLRILSELSEANYASKPDNSLIFAQQCYELAAKLDDQKYKANSLVLMASAYGIMADYAKDITLYLKALKIYQSEHDDYNIIRIYVNMSDDYSHMRDYQKGMLYAKKADSVFRSLTAMQQKSRFKMPEMIAYAIIGDCYLFAGKLDSAEAYLQKVYRYANLSNNQGMIGNVSRSLGELAAARGQKEKALRYFENAFTFAAKANDIQAAGVAQLSIANLYQKTGRLDSAIFYGQKALLTARSANFKQDALEACMALYGYYDQNHNLTQAFKYYKMATAIKDSLFSQNVTRQLVSAGYEEKQNQLEVAAVQERYQNKMRTYALIAGMAILMLLSVIFWRNSDQRKKANRLLQTQKEELATTLGQLQQTKDQLIQSEKMASLGELTAGIAHEIQNPLNFVNNFSEVSAELLAELKDEVKAGHTDDVLAIADDLTQNLEKITHHGKRADSIVKGMLEHSRISTGQKELTDLNKLTDEYLRLAYQGLRVKEKSFNAELLTHFDTNLPLVTVIPQDIGRVLLNIFNNAFYAVQQKAKTAGPLFNPTIEVSTAQNGKQVLITIKDNGTGIPYEVMNKIMQPFFTTKPTGQGTGLGLSLSYDIVVKGHGGQLTVTSQEGEYAQFEILLDPLNC